MAKLTNSELFDIRTMRYFIPKHIKGWRIREHDKRKMSDLSSRGIQPRRRTKGFELLRWGKTYRDLQITMWREDIMDGIITKAEIYGSVPAWLREWVETKLENVPYDAEHRTSNMLIKMYHGR